jgi:ornithine carbamoyltransferase
MTKRDLLSLLDLNSREIKALLLAAAHLKERRRKGKHDSSLQGKTLGLLFHKSSVITRVSFETAMFQMGGSTIVLAEGDTRLSGKEKAADTVRVLSRYLQGLVIGTFEQEFVVEMANRSPIPVINGLSNLYHPCQVLSDLFTILEKKKEIEGLRIAWVGDGTNVAHSWVNAASRLEFTLALACPKEYGLRKDVLDKAREIAGDRIMVTHEPKEAAANADVINTDVWISMGQEKEGEQKLKAFEGFQINRRLMALAKPDAIVLHCLPADRGREISSEIMDDPRSVFFDQAENKMHLHKALLSFLIGGDLEK